jgi:1-acyl-sn-glycerol-3-phosphate acyltransferase
VIAYPHTSNWDLPFMLAIAWALGVNVSWLGKKNLFAPAYGWFMRGVGGIAVDRSRSTRLVDAVVAAIEPRQKLMLVISPEGTRSQTGHWKSGFYWVAVGARVPIILGFLDYTRRCGGLGEVFEPSGQLEDDMKTIRDFYSGMEGKYPSKQGEIVLENVAD